MKNAQAPRNKPHEVEEASSALIVTRKCFRQLALDYVLQVLKTNLENKPCWFTAFHCSLAYWAVMNWTCDMVEDP